MATANDDRYRVVRMKGTTYATLKKIQKRIFREGTTKAQRALGVERPDFVSLMDAAVRALLRAK